MAKTQTLSIWDAGIVRGALIASVRKLDPQQQSVAAIDPSIHHVLKNQTEDRRCAVVFLGQFRF